MLLFQKRRGAQRAVARGALRVEAVGGHVSGDGRGRGVDIGVLANAARSHRVRRAAFTCGSSQPPLAAVFMTEATDTGVVMAGLEKRQAEPINSVCADAPEGGFHLRFKSTSAGCGAYRYTELGT